MDRLNHWGYLSNLHQLSSNISSQRRGQKQRQKKICSHSSPTSAQRHVRLAGCQCEASMEHRYYQKLSNPKHQRLVVFWVSLFLSLCLYMCVWPRNASRPAWTLMIPQTFTASFALWDPWLAPPLAARSLHCAKHTKRIERCTSGADSLSK